MLSKFEAWILSLDCVDVDATKSAWRDDAADIRSLDSLQVDATMPAWRLCGGRAAGRLSRSGGALMYNCEIVS